jgi:hypothetical protein
MSTIFVPFTFTVTWIGPHCMDTDGPRYVFATMGFFFFGLTFARAEATGEARATTVTTAGTALCIGAPSVQMANRSTWT